MARRTTIRQTSTDRAIEIEIAGAVALPRALPICTPEFALEKLAPPANGAKRIALNDEDR